MVRVPFHQQTIMSNKDDVSIDMNFCRICFEPAPPELISPCNCKGTINWVHRHCLDTWIEASNSNTCEICYQPYELDGQRIVRCRPIPHAALLAKVIVIDSFLCVFGLPLIWGMTGPSLIFCAFVVMGCITLGLVIRIIVTY